MFRQIRPQVWLALLLLAGICASGRAGELTCAVVPAKGTDFGWPVLALLEIELSRNGRFQLVDRAQIQTVLREQEVQATIGAEGVAARHRLGNLLRADLLLLFGKQERGETVQLDVVVSETKQGLRLASESYVWSDEEAAGLIAKVADVVASAAEKIGHTGAEAIVAVPPFECEDLTFEYAHLARTYALLLERALQHQPGVLAVELAEADALSRELALSAGADSVERALPHYFMGRYRNTGRGEERTMTVRVDVRRGGQDVLTYDRADLTPGMIARYLSEVADKAGSVFGDRDVASISNAAAEAALLQDRGKRFERLGNWDEALALYEAVLLLAPDQASAHANIVTPLRWLTEAHYDAAHGKAHFAAEARRALAYYRAGLEHLEKYLRTSRASFRSAQWNWLGGFCGALDSFYRFARDREINEITSMYSAVARTNREILLGILEDRARAGTLDAGLASALIWQICTREWMIGGPATSHYEHRLQAARSIQDHANAHGLTLALLSADPVEEQSPQFERFLAELEQLPSEGVRAAVARKCRELEERQQRILRGREIYRELQEQKKNRKPAAPTISFEKLRLTAEGRSGRPGKVTGHIGTWLPCQNGVDLAGQSRGLFVMKEPGKLRRIFRSREQRFNFLSLSFDGRYVWAPVMRPEPLVLVIDPVSETIWEVTAEHGLPPTSRGFCASPVAAGQLCVYGVFSSGAGSLRGWVGLLTFDPEHGTSVDAIHEAREHGNRDHEGGDAEHTWGRDIAGHAYSMCTIPDFADPANTRVLLNRGLAPAWLINPVNKTCELRPRLTRSLDEVVTSDPSGVVYVHDSHRLRRVHASLETDYVGRGLPCSDAQLVFGPQRVHVVGDYWWTAESPADPFTWQPGNIPGDSSHRRVCRSNHYGLVVLTSDDGVYRVQFLEGLSSEGNAP